jgi:hypothetical protein
MSFAHHVRRLCGISLTGAALAWGLGAHAAPPAGPDGHAVEKHFSHHLDGQLNQLGTRLEIKASQETAWQAFRSAFTELLTPSGKPGEHGKADLASGDAATLAKQHADHAADHAQKLAKVADATAKLEAALTPEQRLVLDEAARHFIQRQHARGGFGMAHSGTDDHCEGAGGPPPHGGPHGEPGDAPWHHDGHDD